MLPSAIGKEEVENSHSEIPPCLFRVGNPALPLLSDALMRGHSSTCSRVLCPFPALFTTRVHRQMPRYLYVCPRAPCQPSPMCTHSFPVVSPVLHNPCTSKRLVHRSCTPCAFTSCVHPKCKLSPSEWGAFTAGWSVGELPLIIRRREARGEGVGMMGLSIVYAFPFPSLTSSF